MDFGASLFGGTKEVMIPKECKVVFVSDNFVEDYVGGAELTSEALIPGQRMRIHLMSSSS